MPIKSDWGVLCVCVCFFFGGRWSPSLMRCTPIFVSLPHIILTIYCWWRRTHVTRDAAAHRVNGWRQRRHRRAMAYECATLRSLSSSFHHYHPQKHTHGTFLVVCTRTYSLFLWPQLMGFLSKATHLCVVWSMRIVFVVYNHTWFRAATPMRAAKNSLSSDAYTAIIYVLTTRTRGYKTLFVRTRECGMCVCVFRKF